MLILFISYFLTQKNSRFLLHLDLYHAYRNLDTSSLHDSNNINQNFSTQPYFDFAVTRNVTTRVGQTAFLNCRVEQLGDKLVSFPPSFFIAFVEIRFALWAQRFFSIWMSSRDYHTSQQESNFFHSPLLFTFLCRWAGFAKETFIY